MKNCKTANSSSAPPHPISASEGGSLQEALTFGCQVAGSKCGVHGYDGIVVRHHDKWGEEGSRNENHEKSRRRGHTGLPVKHLQWNGTQPVVWGLFWGDVVFMMNWGLSMFRRWRDDDMTLRHEIKKYFWSYLISDLKEHDPHCHQINVTGAYCSG